MLWRSVESNGFAEKRKLRRIGVRMLKKCKSDFCNLLKTCSLLIPKTVFDERTQRCKRRTVSIRCPIFRIVANSLTLLLLNEGWQADAYCSPDGRLVSREAEKSFKHCGVPPSQA